MASGSTPWQRRLEAAESANRLLVEAGASQTQQIDVFAMCEQLGMWLAFFPLDGILGAFLPEGVGGVLITTQRPVTVQRYTAAHELGHWRLDHGYGVDGEEQVLGTSPAESEQLAQVFAASLLMPPPLVFGILERIGIDAALTPANAYTLAREAGVSYEAAVRHLGHLDVIDSVQVMDLLGVRPLDIKKELARGRRPRNGYADVWPVDEHWHDHELSLRVEDEVLISLPENRSTGYRWMFDSKATPITVPPTPPPLGSEQPSGVIAASNNDLSVPRARFLRQIEETAASEHQPPRAAIERAKQSKPALQDTHTSLFDSFEVVEDRYIPARDPDIDQKHVHSDRLGRLGRTLPALGRSGEPTVGGTGRRLLGLRFATAGQSIVSLTYTTPYRQEAPIEQYLLRAAVEPRRHQYSVDQLANDPDEEWVSNMRDRQQTLTTADLASVVTTEA